MKKKIYTGAYLLNNSDNKTQFGIIDGSAVLNDIPNIRINLGKQIVSKMIINSEELTINLTLDECNKMCEILKTVENSIKILTNLSKNDKLKDEAYLFEE